MIPFWRTGRFMTWMNWVYVVVQILFFPFLWIENRVWQLTPDGQYTRIVRSLQAQDEAPTPSNECK